jgi:glutaconyl-CoA/methylmalonyl-CoA decarboxylase subunit gamma
VRLTVAIDGKPTVVEVSDDLATVRVGERSYPVRVVAEKPTRVELEIGGEAVVVDGWPDRQPDPPGPLDVNGERRKVSVTIDRPAGTAAVRPTGATPTGASAPGAVDPPPAAPVPAGATAIVPPMPGRVVEVRVAEGQAVARGAVLLVVEAMKMRNEVTAPTDGVVRELKVREGSSVRAREPMLLLVPK